MFYSIKCGMAECTEYIMGCLTGGMWAIIKMKVAYTVADCQTSGYCFSGLDHSHEDHSFFR